MTQQQSSKPVIGISSCLLGQNVRFDGGHKRSGFCTKVLADHVEYVPVCPEMGIGMGTPRPSMRLVKKPVGDDQIAIRAITSEGDDVTDQLTEFAEKTTDTLGHLSGYVVCAKSPSCGMERVKVYAENGYGSKEGVGLYTQKLMEKYPNLPVEEQGRLNDTLLKENFLTRVYTYRDWKDLLSSGLTKQSLIDFHSGQKYLLMAHNPMIYKACGRLLANLKGDLEPVASEYISLLMRGLSKPATRKTHASVLQHLQGYFKKQLTNKQRKELTQTIDAYRKGTLPLMAPLTLIKHYQNEFESDYLAKQSYLSPHPDELSLRYAI